MYPKEVAFLACFVEPIGSITLSVSGTFQMVYILVRCSSLGMMSLTNPSEAGMYPMANTFPACSITLNSTGPSTIGTYLKVESSDECSHTPNSTSRSTTGMSQNTFGEAAEGQLGLREKRFVSAPTLSSHLSSRRAEIAAVCGMEYCSLTLANDRSV
jgi:hypothetical protein